MKIKHVIKRRKIMHAIVLVGPPDCGKSCLVEAITINYGVQFFGTSTDAQFVVFDDVKRLIEY